MHTSGYRARLMPTLSESVLPPLSLRTTTSGSGHSRGTCTERTAARVGTSAGITRGTSTRSNSARSRSNVASVEPSSMTTTSNSGYRRASIARTASVMPASSLWAGTSTETGLVSGLRYSSSRPAIGTRRRWCANSTAASAISTR